MNAEQEKTELIRCITAHQLWEKNRVASPPGDIFQPRLVAISHLSRRNNARVPHHAADVSGKRKYCGGGSRHPLLPSSRYLSRKVLESTLASTNSNRLLPTSRVTRPGPANLHPGKPITVLEAFSVVHNWSCTNMGDRPLRRTLWQDRKAIFDHLTPQPIDDHSNATGKWPITQPKTQPNYLPWITYTASDILQAPRTVVLCCPADLLSYSATARYVIRENGQENIVRLRPKGGTTEYTSP